MNNEINNWIKQNGFNPNSTGTVYLSYIIQSYIAQPDSSMVELYHLVADDFHKDWNNIERCVRHCKATSERFRNKTNKSIIITAYLELR